MEVTDRQRRILPCRARAARFPVPKRLDIFLAAHLTVAESPAIWHSGKRRTAVFQSALRAPNHCGTEIRCSQRAHQSKAHHQEAGISASIETPGTSTAAGDMQTALGTYPAASSLQMWARSCRTKRPRPSTAISDKSGLIGRILYSNPKILVPLEGLEPPTRDLGRRRSVQLSYRGRPNTLVEIAGLEPATSALRTPRSPS